MDRMAQPVSDTYKLHRLKTSGVLMARNCRSAQNRSGSNHRMYA